MDIRDVSSARQQTVAAPGVAQPVRLLLILICGLALFVCACVVAELLLSRRQDEREAALHAQQTAVRDLRAAIVDADAAVSSYILTGREELRSAYAAAVGRLTEQAGEILPEVDAGRWASRRNSQATTVSTLGSLRAAWDKAVALAGEGRRAEAALLLRDARAPEMSERLHNRMETYLTQQSEAEKKQADRVASWLTALRVATLAGILTSVTVKLVGSRRIGNIMAAGRAARHHVEQLFALGDVLQSAVDMDDTTAVLRASALRLMPNVSGALYVFNNSRDRLDLATRWGELPAGHADHIAPNDCWALKRGKSHLNGTEEAALRCTHAAPGLMTLDIPMMARGQLHGLLEVAADGPYAAERLETVRPIAAAIADAMSLALSNAALRNQLRSQALRDGLTGLYNRRFLEEVLERLCIEAERRGSEVAMIMLDLDHFKRLNDTHGHAMGDAVLREVAAAVQGAIRPTDIACRYGGEELVILLPDCGLEMAAVKAEQIRVRIAGLAFAGSRIVTGSFGVAALPSTAANQQALFAAADAALYEAKKGGRDRVVTAPRPGGGRDTPDAGDQPAVAVLAA